MKPALLCTALLVVAVPGYADEAIRTEAYSPQSRTSLVIQQGRVTNITFNVMERIKRIVAVEPGPISTLGKDSSNQEPMRRRRHQWPPPRRCRRPSRHNRRSRPNSSLRRCG